MARLEYKLLLQGALQLLSCVVDELEGAIQAQLASSQRAEAVWEPGGGGGSGRAPAAGTGAAAGRPGGRQGEVLALRPVMQ